MIIFSLSIHRGVAEIDKSVGHKILGEKGDNKTYKNFIKAYLTSFHLMMQQVMGFFFNSNTIVNTTFSFKFFCKHNKGEMHLGVF